MPTLYDLIEEAYNLKLFSKRAYEAAHRIRKWGNKIHPAQVAYKNKLPNIGQQNLKSRLKDLNLVLDQLLKTI